MCKNTTLFFIPVITYYIYYYYYLFFIYDNLYFIESLYNLDSKIYFKIECWIFSFVKNLHF